MQFNSNSDFPASQLPTSQWVQVARPPVPFDDPIFHPCACITTRVLIQCDSSEALYQGVGVEDAQHVMVAGRHYIIKTAKGVLVRTDTPEWSGSSSSDDEDDDDQRSNKHDGHATIAMSAAQPQLTSATATEQQAHLNNVSTTERAYWLQRSLRIAIYGCVRYGIVLHKLNPPIPVLLPNTSEWVTVEWKETRECVAIKEMNWDQIRRLRNQLAEDPIKEMAAMQYLGKRLSEEEEEEQKRQWQLQHAAIQLNSQITEMNLATLQLSQFMNAPMSSNSMFTSGDNNTTVGNPHWPPMSVPQAAPTIQDTLNNLHPNPTGSHHIMIPMDFLSDDRNLYSVMPYCSGGELFDVLEKKSRFSEPEARYWMRQLLKGLSFLKRWGVCHRDLSLENLLVQDGNVLIIDMGMCLRIPYASLENCHLSTSNQHHNDNHHHQRYLLSPQGVCGKWHYMSPEVCGNQLPFDGPAVDLWAAGVILFLMLTGYPPWEKPELTDNRFKYMSNGYLVQMLTEWQVGLSADAMDLLQRMFWLDPTDRLSLEQVCAHPWMTVQN